MIGLQHTVVRGIMRAARILDRNSGYKALLSLESPTKWNRKSMVWEENPEFREKDAFLGGILGGGAAYRPSCEIETEILNGLRREALGESDAIQLMATLREAVSIGERSFQDQDQGVSVQGSWPLELDSGPISPGTVLVAHPTVVRGPLRRAVVLVAAHREDTGGHGIILNLPSTATVGQAQKHKYFDAFRNVNLYIGGASGNGSSMTMIHRHSDIDRSVAIAPNVSYGGCMEAIDAAVKDGAVLPEDFQCARGWSSWLPSEMEGYVSKNLMIQMRSDDLHSIISPHNPEFRFSPQRDTAGSRSPTMRECRDHAEAVWGKTMSSLGGEYAEMARISFAKQCGSELDMPWEGEPLPKIKIW